MKTIKGLPTKKAVRELCEAHDFIPRALDSFSLNPGYAVVTWSSSRCAGAKPVVESLRAAGFRVDVLDGDPKAARPGSMRIYPKATP